MSRTAGRLAVGTVLTLVVLGAWLPAPAGAGPGRREPPRSWDDRILELARFVEDDRGLDFDHPVTVEFLSERKFRRRVRADEDDVSEQQRRRAEEAAGQLHALGLLGEDVDLVDATNELDEGTVSGYYDTDREVMVVRGKELDDVELRVTVVHELVHALQDQHFDLDGLYDRADTSGELFALDALVEGDATFVENDYVFSLPRGEQDEYFGDLGIETPAPDAVVPEGVPLVLEVYTAVPYTIGASFVYVLDALGPRERDRAFEDPPTTDEQIMDPLAWHRRGRSVRVPTPELGPGERKAGHADELGAFTLFLLLAARTDQVTALEAATGWGGDRYVGFEADGRQCVRAALVGDRPRDTDEIESALVSWSGTLPEGMATVARDGDAVEVTSCETDGVSEPGPEVVEEAVFATLDNRLVLTADLLFEFDASVRAARCAAQGMVLDPELGPILQRLFAEGLRPEDLERRDQEAFVERSVEHLGACGLR